MAGAAELQGCVCDSTHELAPQPYRRRATSRSDSQCDATKHVPDERIDLARLEGVERAVRASMLPCALPLFARIVCVSEPAGLVVQ